MPSESRQTGSTPPGSVGSGAAGQLLQRAAGLYARGNLQGAESACRQLLQIRPDQADARHILGLVAWRRGDRQGAVAEIRQAIAVAPNKPQPHNSLGVLLKEEGNAGGAEAAFRTAVGLQPDYPEALTNLGNILSETGQLAEAEARHRRVVELAPGYADGHNNLATALAKQERWEEAIEACRAAVRLEPSRAEFQLNLGNSLAAAKVWEEAAEAFRQAADLAPTNADCHTNLGVALERLGLFGQAADALGIAVRLRPGSGRLWTDLGSSLAKSGRADDAINACRKAVEVEPELPEARNALGRALFDKGMLAEAAAAFERAIGLRPDYALAHTNLGVTRHAEGRFAEAFAAHDRAFQSDPQFTETQFNRATTHLLLGEFEVGWRLYEFGLGRRSGPGGPRFDEHPPWQGTPVGGKTLLIWSEQGVGDQIMFASVIPDLLAQGARCVVEADARLKPLFSRSLEGVQFRATNAGVPAEIAGLGVDYQIPLGGLCRWLRPNLASFSRQRPFLRADAAQSAAFRTRYRERFGDRPTVGISWMGGTGIARSVRSIPLAEWSPILRQPGAAFVNLQYGDCAAELATVSDALGVEIFQDSAVDPMKDLDGFAAQTAALDLVISIDNSTVHMAGALGIPVWVMLPTVPDWRWLLGRSDTPWYSSARLFRQANRGEWGGVLAAVSRELAYLSGAQTARHGSESSNSEISSAQS
jgi:tetratricopeptide (TPR) repeat protein